MSAPVTVLDSTVPAWQARHAEALRQAATARRAGRYGYSAACLTLARVARLFLAFELSTSRTRSLS